MNGRTFSRNPRKRRISRHSVSDRRCSTDICWPLQSVAKPRAAHTMSAQQENSHKGKLIRTHPFFFAQCPVLAPLDVRSRQTKINLPASRPLICHGITRGGAKRWRELAQFVSTDRSSHRWWESVPCTRDSAPAQWCPRTLSSASYRHFSFISLSAS